MAARFPRSSCSAKPHEWMNSPACWAASARFRANTPKQFFADMKLKIFFALIFTSLVLVAAHVPKADEQRADGSIVLLATNAVTHGKQIRYEPQPHKNTIGYWTKT